MRYVSTRGGAPVIGFREAVLAGLAVDGGLYAPEFWPQMSMEEMRGFSRRAFAEVAATVISKFSGGELSEADILPMSRQAFAQFDTDEVAPVASLGGDDFLLELFHGPTLAFKDIAMSMLAELYGWALADSARGKTIIGATSGDTGGAAIHAFAGSAKAEVFMLHPKGRISDVQRRIMTTVASSNIVNVAVEGSFDDCQRIVKQLFADDALRAALDLGGVNSINWVRVAVQTVYYFTAAARFSEPVSFVVPTGNFGDVFAGYAARRMGLPVKRLGVAVNRNDIMRRAIETGDYEPAATWPTTSPSMDIQIASNFERVLFDVLDRDAKALSVLMDDLERRGRMSIPAGARKRIAEAFCAARADERDVDQMMREIHERLGMVIDPHTAVGLAALAKMRASGEITGPAVSLATAHPAKFPDAVSAATGARPELPARYRDLFARPEYLVEAPASADAVREILFERSRFI